jgi:tRNA_anti-like
MSVAQRLGQCSACGEGNPHSNKMCSQCGAMLPWTLAALSSAQNRTAPLPNVTPATATPPATVPTTIAPTNSAQRIVSALIFWAVVIGIFYAVQQSWSSAQVGDGSEGRATKLLAYVTTERLASDYQENMVAADQSYYQKPRAYAGTIEGFDTNFGTKVYLDNGVICHFDGSQDATIAQLHIGQMIGVSGVCQGKTWGQIDLQQCVYKEVIE